MVDATIGRSGRSSLGFFPLPLEAETVLTGRASLGWGRAVRRGDTGSGGLPIWGGTSCLMGAMLPAGPFPNKSVSKRAAKSLSNALAKRMPSRSEARSGGDGAPPSLVGKRGGSRAKRCLSVASGTLSGFRSGIGARAPTFGLGCHPTSVATTASIRRVTACPARAGALLGSRPASKTAASLKSTSARRSRVATARFAGVDSSGASLRLLI